MDDTNVQIGQIVLSKNGRDAGKYAIVYKIVDSNYVLLVDGHSRTLSNPKMKKLKHIELQPNVIKKIADKFVDGTVVFDSEIRSGLKIFTLSKGEK